jgi:hypothetical protein
MTWVIRVLAFVLTALPVYWFEDNQHTVMTFNIRYGTANDGEDSWPNRDHLVMQVLAISCPPQASSYMSCQGFAGNLVRFCRLGFMAVGTAFTNAGWPKSVCLCVPQIFSYHFPVYFFCTESGSSTWPIVHNEK